MRNLGNEKCYISISRNLRNKKYQEMRNVRNKKCKISPEREIWEMRNVFTLKPRNGNVMFPCPFEKCEKWEMSKRTDSIQ